MVTSDTVAPPTPTDLGWKRMAIGIERSATKSDRPGSESLLDGDLAGTGPNRNRNRSEPETKKNVPNRTEPNRKITKPNRTESNRRRFGT